jgi:acylglycerol lipase
MRSFRKLLLLIPLLFGLSICEAMPPASPLPQHPTAAVGATGRLMKTHDGLTLFGQWWAPHGHPRAVVLLIHGTAMNSGFYAPWANELRDHHYAVFGIDLRGWGQSQGFGPRGYVGDYNEYLEDLSQAFAEVHRRYPGVPVFVQGESLGGTVALLAGMSNRFPMAGLVLNAPAIHFNPGYGMLRLPDGIMNAAFHGAASVLRVAPTFPVAPIVLENQLFKVDIFDPATRRRFIDDPNNLHSYLPAGYVTAMATAGDRVEHGIGQLRLPLIVLHGGSDHVIPLSCSQFVMERTSSPDKTLRIYPGVSHLTLDDTGHEQVWADIVHWLDRHTAPRHIQPLLAQGES